MVPTGTSMKVYYSHATDRYEELTTTISPGEFIAKFPLIPGHEAIGTIVEMGKNVKGFEMGDRCVADVGVTVSDQLQTF